MALTKVSGPLLHGSNDNLGNYVINNITGVAATFTGNVSVGGTLTYDDVTNVDSIGIVTARGGLHVGAGGTIIYALSEDDGNVGIGTTDASHQITVYAKSANSTIARFKAVNRNSNFDIVTDSSSHGQARVRNNIGATKVLLNSNGDSYFTGGDVGIGTDSPTDILDVFSVTDPTIRSRSGLSTVGANIEICGGSSNDSQLILSSGTTAKYQFFRDGSQSDDLRIYDSTNTLDIMRYRHGGYLHFGVNGAERLRITADGKTLIHGGGATGANNTSSLLPNGYTLNIHGTSSNDGISVVRYNASYGAYGLNIGKSNNSTFGTNTLVTDGEELGHVSFYGADGTDFNMAAQITGEVDGTPSDGTDMPGALSFRTSSEASGTPTERLRITSGGGVKFISADSPSSTTEPAQILNHSGGWQFYASSASNTNRNIIIGTNSVAAGEKLRITSGGNIGINSTSPNAQFVLNRSLTENNAIEMGYSSSSGGLHFIQAYNRSTSAFTKLVLNNSIGISTGGKVEFTADVNPVAEFDRGSANNTNLNLKYNGNFYGQVSVANTDFQLSAVGSNTNLTIFANGASRAKFTSVGQFVVGTDPNVNSGNIAHIEAPTGFNNGETIVEIAGDNAAAGPRLALRNRNTGASARSEILGSDSGGQSTSSIRMYHTDQGNNYGEIALGTRDAPGPPTDRFRITSTGSAAYKSSTMDNTVHIKVQSSAGNDSTVQYILIAPITTNNIRLMGEFQFTRAAGTSGVSEQVVEAMFLTRHDNDDEQYYVKTKSTSGSFNGIEYEWVQLEYSSVTYYALRSVPRNGSSYWGAYMQHGFFKGTTNACADLGTVLNSSSHTVSNVTVLTNIKNFEASNRVSHIIKQGSLYVQAHSSYNAANFVPSYTGVDDASLPITCKIQSQKQTALELNRMYSHGTILQFRHNNDAVGYFNVNGTSSSHTSTGSDIRLKKDFEDWTEEVLPHFKSLKPQKFRFNSEDKTAEKTKGYIAQDNLDKFPEAYPLNPDDDRYWFAPSNMVPYLMKALQEEIIKREEIEAKYNALEARISALEGS